MIFNKVGENETYRLFSIHGLYPQLPVPLRKGLECNGRVSTATVTEAIKEASVIVAKSSPTIWQNKIKHQAGRKKKDFEESD